MAAISYPSFGLPIILNGPTGTGKSMIAKMMYEYGVNQGIIAKNGQFVVVNCSEYANNPELLTANLFGHKKGAYTGADQDNVGLIHMANNGVLFLDEVHCLKAECQEKLFLFMDKGIYHRVGDNENWYQSNCRLVFATTENPEDVLLKTLLRRIPIIVKIPPLDLRPKMEKQALIASIFKAESEELKLPIKLSSLAYQILMDIDFPGNVGALKNCIKASCANAFLNNTDNKEELTIHIYNLPDYILKKAQTMSFTLQESNDDMLVTLNLPIANSHYDSKLLQTYKKMVETYQNHIKFSNSSNELITKLKHTVEMYNDYLMYDKKQMISPNEDFVKKIVDKIFSIVMNRYSLKISNNDILPIARYLSEYTSIGNQLKKWLKDNVPTIDELLNLLQFKYPREYSIANELVENIKLNLDIDVDSMMHIFIMIMLTNIDNTDHEQTNTVGVILCHGYSTASSMANAVNKMLGQYIFDALDMQLDVSVDKITNQLNDYLKKKSYFEELVLLVDMGSLEEIYKGIKHNNSVNIGIVNNVNTKLALSIGQSIKNNQEIPKILEKASSNNLSQYKYINHRIKKKAILSVCASGVGAAEKILELFKKSLPRSIDAEIISYDYQKLVDNQLNDSIFNKYNVSFIVGTMNPCIDNIPFIAIEDLVLNSDLDSLGCLMHEYLADNDIEILKSNIIKNFTLNNIVNHLTILNAEKVLDDVEEMVSIIEKRLDIQLNSANKVGLFVHLACLIERLILKNEVVLLNDPQQFMELNKDFIDIMQDAFSVAKHRYSVELPVSEIIYVHNYIQNSK